MALKLLGYIHQGDVWDRVGYCAVLCAGMYGAGKCQTTDE
jgi:hypothetical protein